MIQTMGEENPNGTGIFDEDDSFLTNNQTFLLQSSQQCFLTKPVIIIFTIIFFLIFASWIIYHPFQLSNSLALNLQDSDKNISLTSQRANDPYQSASTISQNTKIKTDKSNELAVPPYPKQQQLTPQKNIKEHVQYNNQELIKPSQNNQYPVSEQEYNQRIYAGQIHYSRIPVEYWSHRILMLKAMGLNTLSVYVMWNYHQEQKYIFDYSTENKNLTLFLQLAAKYEMKVLLRPGPYICGQWDYGGLPARLMGVQNLRIRSFNSQYLDQVLVYFKSLAQVIKPFLVQNGGPIHMLQIENEFGSFGSDLKYILGLVQLWKMLGINVQYYIEDAANLVYRNYFQGAAVGVSDGSHPYDYQILKQDKNIKNGTLVFGGEIYPGWMTHWGENWGDKQMEKFVKQMEYLFSNSMQFSLYMAYGGTNFGLTAGANAGIHGLSYEPMITSYDYNSTISEQGRQTNKSDLIVSLMNEYVRPPKIQFPKPIQTISFGSILPRLTASLMENLGAPQIKQQSQLYFFEHPSIAMYNQGIVVYETYLPAGSYTLNLTIHDFGFIFLDDKLIDQHARIKTDTFTTNVVCKQSQCRLLILVEAMGHNNYGVDMNLDIKGLLNCQILLAAEEGEDPMRVKVTWNLYKINIDQSLFTMDKVGKHEIKHPAIFKGKFNIQNPGDTYINMEKYKKGYVWINGRNLGRYWNRGPQYRLYCPGVWLKAEENEIVILELLTSQQATINGKHTIYDEN